MDLIPISNRQLARSRLDRLPAVIGPAGERVGALCNSSRQIRNKNTRGAYAQACGRFFHWCDDRGFELADLNPVLLASYIE